MDKPTPGSQLKASITDASLKIEGIIDDAERAAADIRAEAREEAERDARRIVSESGAQLASVLEPLIKRVENLRVESAALMHELEAATLELVDLSKRTAEPVITEVSEVARTRHRRARDAEGGGREGGSARRIVRFRARSGRVSRHCRRLEQR